MVFLPRNIVGCLLKKGLQRGGSRAPQDLPPSLRPWAVDGARQEEGKKGTAVVVDTQINKPDYIDIH